MLAAAISDNDGGRERRCIATGAILPEQKLVRFVIGPDSEIVPDIDAKLPGHGMWLTADPAIIARAIAKNDFAKAAKASVKIAPGLAALVERLLAARMQSDLGLARRAGLLVLGFDNVLRELHGKVPPRVLVEAMDGAPDGRRKLVSASRDLNIDLIDRLSCAELSLALGRENVIHAAVRPGPLAHRLIFNSARLTGFRVRPPADAMPGSARNERNV